MLEKFRAISPSLPMKLYKIYEHISLVSVKMLDNFQAQSPKYPTAIYPNITSKFFQLQWTFWTNMEKNSKCRNHCYVEKHAGSSFSIQSCLQLVSVNSEIDLQL